MTEATPIPIELTDQLAIGPIVLTTPDSQGDIVIASSSEPLSLQLSEFFRGPAGPGGSGGSGGSDHSLTFTQSSASATWNITHGFGRYPAVMVVDSAGDLILADISFPSVNNIIIRFSAATTGSAYLS